MEEAALLAAQGDEVSVDEGATILMPATQSPLVQQPTVVIQQHAVAASPSPYGLVPSHLVHAGHPALHAAQFHHQHVMASAQPQLVQLPNGQMAYATPSSIPYQAGAPMIAMPHHLQAAAMPQHVMLSSGGMHPHQMQVAAHPGIAVTNAQYVTHMMAAQAQAQAQAHAQAQAQAVQMQAAQAQAAHAQAAQFHGLVPGMHIGQHVMQGVHPQGQFILVPRLARPHI